MSRFKDYIVIFLCCYIPMFIDSIRPCSKFIDYISLTIMIFAILPYIISGKCIVEVLWSKHPIRNMIIVYRKYSIVYYIAIVLIGLTILNYLLAFKIL
jgi:hypothetical protein